MKQPITISIQLLNHVTGGVVQPAPGDDFAPRQRDLKSPLPKFLNDSLGGPKGGRVVF